MQTVKRSVTDVEGGVGGKRGGGFLDNETISYDPIVVDKCHHKLVQADRMFNTKREPQRPRDRKVRW